MCVCVCAFCVAYMCVCVCVCMCVFVPEHGTQPSSHFVLFFMKPFGANAVLQTLKQYLLFCHACRDTEQKWYQNVQKELLFHEIP